MRVPGLLPKVRAGLARAGRPVRGEISEDAERAGP
jgi:hypothetical protein